MIRRVIVAGGGTGGHLFPGIAVVEELRRREPNLEVLFIGTERGVEARVIPSIGEQLVCIDVAPLKGRTRGELVRGLSLLPGAFSQAMRTLRSFKPDLVLGVGGYASGPTLTAAATLSIPTALLEQNAHVGLTNRMLGRFVGRAYIAFSETSDCFSPSRVRTLGNPVRRALVDAVRRAMADPEGFEARSRGVFVLGGSQGAGALNAIVPRALAHAMRSVSRDGEQQVPILHQSGVKMRDEVAKAYADAGLEAEVVPFIDDVARAYASSAVVIARAGATTVAELCAIGRPSILVPYPHAADDHQTKNAQSLEKAGAAIFLPERELTPERLGEVVTDLLGDAEKRRSMAARARSLGRPDAAAAIVDDLCEWLGGPQSGPDASHAYDDVNDEEEPTPGNGQRTLRGSTLQIRFGVRSPQRAMRVSRRPLVMQMSTAE